MLELLGDRPEFFTARGATGRDIVAFAIVAALVPPILMLALELLAGLASASLAWALQLAYVAALVAVIVLQLLPFEAWLPALGLALAAGAGFAVGYARSRRTRSTLAVLAPVPLVLLAVFVLLSDVAPLVTGAEAEAAGVPTTPIVLVIFDEFPVQSLMAADGRIDAVRYPNFARLARDSTWYRNTASVDQDTPYAVPAILDGRLPRRDRLPVAADHPRNLFTLLAGRYELHVREDATAMCAPRVCAPLPEPGAGGRMGSLWRDAGLVWAHGVLPERLKRVVPAVERQWDRLEDIADPDAAVATTARVPRESKPHRFVRLHTNLARGRVPRFDGFVRDIEGGSQPRLHLIHILLPHVPYQFLPTGSRYRRTPIEAIPGLDTRPGYGVPFLTAQSYQRHLLQVGATDRLLGHLLDRLERIGLYDRAAVAVVADHGISFRLGHDHRLVRAANVEDIAPVPFFMKAPGQRRGRISDKPLRTIDVLPTLADVAGFSIPWPVDGRSALRSTSDAQRHRVIVSKRFRHVYSVDTPGYARRRAAALRRKLRLFGHSVELYGPRRDLVGRRVARLDVRPAGESAHVVDADEYDEVAPASGFVPAHVVGRIEAGRLGGGRVVAAALNGTIAATGRTFTLAGDDDEQFSLLLPERDFRAGANRLQLLLLGGTPGASRLYRLRCGAAYDC
jgi:hypothetical protein